MNDAASQAPSKDKKAPRDIRFRGLPVLDWTAEQARSSADQVAAMALEYATTSVEWYLGRKGGKRLGARIARLSAILFVLAAGLVPLFGQIWSTNGKPDINPLWSAIALVLAAGAVGIDRFFGFSAAYIRYLTAGMKLQRVVQDFNLEWQMRRAALTGADPTPAQVQDALDGCRKFLSSVDEVIQAETEGWVQEFTTALAEIDKSTRAQSETARGGAIDLVIVNGDKCQDGWQLVVDGGNPDRRTGKTAAVRGLLAGTHLVSVSGKIDNVSKLAEKNVVVTSGSVVQVELTLT